MSDAPPQAIPIEQGATIVADLPCFFCQYNLRTLSIDGNCPECGHAVGECIRTGWLVFSDPGWIGKLRTGVTILLWLLLATILGYVGFGAYVMLRAMPTTPGPPDLLGIQIFSSVLVICFSSAWLASVWYLTSPEPAPQAGPRRSKLCGWIRILNAAPLLAVIIIIVFGFAVSHPYGPASLIPMWGPTQIVMFLMSAAGQVAYAVGLVLLAVHMRRIARRDVKKGLARLMTFLLWGGAVLSVGFGGSALVLGLYARTAFLATATTAPVTTASATQASSTAPASGYTTSVSVSPWGNVRLSQAALATTSAPAATTGPAGISAPPPVAMGYATLTTATTTMPAGAPPMPFGRGFMIWAFAMCASQLLAVGWFISGVVALFWFRRVFTRAIRQHTGPPPVIASSRRNETAP